MLPEGRCPRCAFRQPCLCARIPRVETRLRIDVIRHAAEQWKTTNSVRWLQVATRCRVFEYGRLKERFDPRELGDTRDAWLLFPGPHETALPETPPARIIVPDGTWQQARRMVSRIDALRTLPRLTLPPSPRIRLRRQHLEHGHSTLEAVADALAAFGETRAAEQLGETYQLALREIEERRGYPLEG